MISNMDAREGLRSLADCSIDVVITDIPYKTIAGGNKAPEAPKGMLSKNDGKIFKHNDIKIEEYAGELYRVLTDCAHVWMFTNELNRRTIENEMHRVGFKTHYLGGWIKNNVTPSQWGMKNVEPFFVFRKGKARPFYTPSLKQFIECDNIIGNKQHPTEKPVELLTKMVFASSQEGETVLDPFIGSGSTCVAAKEAGRRFRGFEIDPKHYLTACKRLNVMP